MKNLSLLNPMMNRLWLLPLLWLTFGACTPEYTCDFLVVGDSTSFDVAYTRLSIPLTVIPIDTIYAFAETDDTLNIDVDMDHKPDMAIVIKQYFKYEKDIYWYRIPHVGVKGYGNTLFLQRPYEFKDEYGIKTCNSGEVVGWNDTWTKNDSWMLANSVSQGPLVPWDRFDYIPFRIGNKYLGWVHYTIELEQSSHNVVHKITVDRFGLKRVK